MNRLNSLLWGTAPFLMLLFLIVSDISAETQAILTVGDNCTFQDIEDAINAAASGDIIRVQGRTYTGGAAEIDITDKSLTLIGGYDNTCTTKFALQTRLDATGTGDSVIEIRATAARTVILQDFNITGGSDDPNFGGGIEVDPNITLTLSGTHVQSNDSANGAGVHLDGSTLILQNRSLIYGNDASADGGGVFCRNGTIHIDGFSSIGPNLGFVTPNEAIRGGGIFADNCIVHIGQTSEASVLDNVAVDGAGIYATGASSLNAYTSGIVTNNSATGNGGGIYLDGGTTLDVNQAQISNNQTSADGGALYINGDGNKATIRSTTACSPTTCARVHDNSAARGGIAYLNKGGRLTLSRVYADGNSATTNAAAVFADTLDPIEITFNNVMLTRGNTVGDLFHVVESFPEQATLTLEGVTIADVDGLTSDDRLITLSNNADLFMNAAAVSPINEAAILSGGNSTSVSCSVLPAAPTAGSTSNNLIATPVFLLPANGIYHLSPTSPGVDICPLQSLNLDIDGEARPNNGAIDAGADEVYARVGTNVGLCQFNTIAAAISSVGSGGTVYIPAGTYNELLGDINKNVTLVQANANCTAATNGSAGSVVIDANDAGGRTFGGVARITNGATVAMRHMTLRDGSATSGGVLAVDAGATLTLDRVEITQGNASAQGGGLFVAGSADLTDQTRIYGNTSATDGGGITLSGSVNVRDTSTIGIGGFPNTATNFGGGVNLTGNGQLHLHDNSAIRANSASRGGGVYAANGSDLFVNANAVIGGDSDALRNTASLQGGGVFLTDDGTTATINGTVQRNFSQSGGGLYVTTGARLTVDGGDITDNRGGFTGGITAVGSNSSPTTQIILQNGAVVSGNFGALAGGIYLSADNISLTATDSTITGNSVNGNDTSVGGIRADRATNAIVLTRSTVSQNVSNTGSGGGIGVSGGGTLRVVDSTISKNSAQDNGGGIAATGMQSVRLEGNTQLRDNTAGGYGGGLYASTSRIIVDDTVNGRPLFGGNESGNDGGGLYIADQQNNELSGVDLSFNTAIDQGGGLFVDNAEVELTTVTLSDNIASDGGAIAAVNGAEVTLGSSFGAPNRNAEECNPLLLAANTYCTQLLNNDASDQGGAIYVSGGALSADTIAILDNEAATGSAIFLTNSASGLLQSSLVADGSVTAVNGSAIDVGGNSTLDLQFNTIADNLGKSVVYAAGTGGNVDGNIIWNSGATTVLDTGATCNNTDSIVLSGNGNISQDPLFETTARGKYRLGVGSPSAEICLSSPTIDLDNRPRGQGTAREMGAFERPDVPTGVRLQQAGTASLHQTGVVRWLGLSLVAITLIILVRFTLPQKWRD